MSTRRFVFAVGGTAGHVIPALAVAAELRAASREIEVSFFGTGTDLERRLVEDQGYRLHRVPAAPFQRTSAAGRVRALVSLPRGMAVARTFLAELAPEVVVGFGGYASVPTLLAAASLGFPTAVHEANAEPGLANRRLAPVVKQVFSGFPGGMGRAGGWGALFVGTPVRRGIVEARAFPRESPLGRPTRVLVLSGSDPSPFLDRHVPALLSRVARRVGGVQAWHQAGADREAAAAAYEHSGIAAVVAPFFDDVPSLLARADLVVTRAGAGALAEIAVAGRPSLLVPLAEASERHQALNARLFASRTGAVCCEEAEWDEDGLAERLARLLSVPASWDAAADAARAVSKPDAAACLAGALLERSGERRGTGAETIGEPVAGSTKRNTLFGRGWSRRSEDGMPRVEERDPPSPEGAGGFAGPRDRGPGQEPIDAVYLWVDGDDPGLKSAVDRWREGPVDGHTSGRRRFRDNGELRHSLRSLERHAPWIRNVFVVHAGAPPAWLDTTSPGLVTVRHEEVFPDPSVLPTFNSYAIELNLHRISGLSRRFLYLNDDFFLARDTPLSWFLPPGGLPRFFFEANAIPLRGASRSANDRACAYTLRFQPWKGPHRGAAVASSRRRWRRLLGLPPRRNMSAHVPQLYDREAIRDLEARFPDEFRATRAHRFRSPDDLALRILYGYTGLARGLLQAVRLEWNSADFHFVGLEDDLERTRKALSRLDHDPPRFLCANDDVLSEAPDPPALLYWKELMARTWPRPSRFERREGPS